jgi:hypothetical protein
MPTAHVWPHAPQLAVSVIRSRQAEPAAVPQSVWLPVQAHWPLWQTWLARQAFVHEPQWAWSEVRSTHWPPHMKHGASGMLAPVASLGPSSEALASP